MRLPIPFIDNGTTYTEIEFGSPSAGLLADTQKAADAGRYFNSLSILCGGVLTLLSDQNGNVIEDRAELRAAAKKLPYRTAELVALRSLLLVSPDDGFEGVYQCPRCQHRIITEQNEDEDEDTRDYVKDLEIGYTDGEIITFDLSEPVEFKSGGEVTDTIESIEMHYPTVSDCIRATKKGADLDEIRQQFSIYAEALETVNGKPINAAWRSTYGPKIFERMNVRDDLPRLGRLMSDPGLSPTVPKRCPKCGKVWNAKVNTSGFFESALRS